MLKLVDKPDLGSDAERRRESPFLNPCHFVTSPFRVASGKETAQWTFPASSLRQQGRLHRPVPMVGSGGPAASTFCESLADADAAALKRLRYDRKSVSFFKSGNPCIFANDVRVFISISRPAEIIQMYCSVFLKLAAAECVTGLHRRIFCNFCNKLEIS